MPPSVPEFAPGSPEREQSPASPERGGEQRQQQVPAQPAPQPVSLPQPQQPNTQTTDDDTAVLSGVPDVAADDDRIEREWVDKAKKIIDDTQGDPYRREQAISQLQQEYLLKRYRKEIGTGD